jgi:protease-4
MKQFFKYVLATITGLVITFFLVVLFFVIVIAGVVSSASKDKSATVKPNSLLHLKFSMPIVERTPNNPFKNFNFSSFSGDKQIGLNDILANIKNAKTDDNIKGIYMDMSRVPAGIATIEEIRNALIDFKTSGKFIISYSEAYGQGAYYLASVADKVYLNPQGNLDWKGLSAQLMFFKGTLEKLDIGVQVFRHGKFKSAVESFDLDKMSSSNRLQTMTYINAIWDHLLEGISKSRKIPVEELDKLADKLSVREPADALKYKMIDGLKYKDEIIEELSAKLNLKKKDKINYVDIGDYTNLSKKERATGKEKIAIIYAVGTIESGDGDDETIGSERVSKAIRDARLDSNIKAIVFRVNSPGGSALASDVIWREALLAKKTKPFIVSMGDVAASGGYYISCAADVIVAQPNTITGSIGVFGLLPNMQKFFSNKLGITVDTANTNRHADVGSALRPVTAEEGQFIQQSVESIYNVFIGKVAEGRKKTPAEIDSIGQGRVWSGIDAKRIGLVDELGGINDAIKIAAAKAKLDKYKIVEFPKQKDILEELLKNAGDGVESRILKNKLGADYEYYKYIKQMTNMNGVQARMSYDVVLY